VVEEHAGNAGRSGVRGANGVLLYPYHPPGVININTKEADNYEALKIILNRHKSEFPVEIQAQPT